MSGGEEVTPLILLAGIALVANVAVLTLRVRATRVMDHEPLKDAGVRRHGIQVIVWAGILLFLLAVKPLGQD